MAFKNYKKEILIPIILGLSTLFGHLSALLTAHGVIIAFSASAFVSFIITIYEKFFWRYFPYLLNVRNISGRYKGTLHSRFNKKSYLITIEIKQTASSVFVNQYTKNEQGISHSQSDFAELKRQNDGRMKLSFSYHNSGDQLRDELDSHLGFCEIIFNTSRDAFNGFYFTNRELQTKGSLEAKKKSSKIRGQF